MTVPNFVHTNFLPKLHSVQVSAWETPFALTLIFWDCVFPLQYPEGSMLTKNNNFQMFWCFFSCLTWNSHQWFKNKLPLTRTIKSMLFCWGLCHKNFIYCIYRYYILWIKLYMVTRTFRSITIYIILLTYPARGAACQGFFHTARWPPWSEVVNSSFYDVFNTNLPIGHKSQL